MRACGRFLPARRTLIGDDLPSFMAERIMPPASKANSRSRKLRVLAKPVRSMLDVFLSGVLAFVLELDLDDRIHRSGVGRVGGRQVGDDPELGNDDLKVIADRLPDEFLDLGDPLFGLLDARAAGGPDVDLEGARIDLGEKLAAQLRSQTDRGSRRAARPRPAPL